MGDIHPVEDFHHLPLAFGLPAAKINQRQFHVLEDCQLVYQVETLEYETLFDLDVHLVQCFRLHLLGGEDHRQILCFNHIIFI